MIVAIFKLQRCRELRLRTWSHRFARLARGDNLPYTSTSLRSKWVWGDDHSHVEKHTRKKHKVGPSAGEVRLINKYLETAARPLEEVIIINTGYISESKARNLVMKISFNSRGTKIY